MEMLLLLAIHVVALGVSLIFLVGVYRTIKRARHAQAHPQHPHVRRAAANPLLTPGTYAWEGAGTFNPAAVLHDGLTHLFYRALGHDGVSRIGYARSEGARIVERDPYPAFALHASTQYRKHRQSRHPGLVASGGSWSGTEDPRAVILEDRLYLSFSAFSGWDSIRMGVVSLGLDDLAAKQWRWSRPVFLSAPQEVHKNWVVFPERIRGKVAVLHSLHGTTPGTVEVAYLDTLDQEPSSYIKSPYMPRSDRTRWDASLRGAAAPPLRTDDGWLLFYHATSHDEGHRYKVGAMLLDLDDPSRIIARSHQPVLVPDEWYENEGAKSGVVYVCGATRDEDDITLYYGGADSHVCAAHVSLERLSRDLVS